MLNILKKIFKKKVSTNPKTGEFEYFQEKLKQTLLDLEKIENELDLLDAKDSNL